MRKFNTLLELPVFNNSGYGRWCDSLALSAIKYPHFNIGILPLDWGDCPLRQLQTEDDALLSSKIIRQRQIQRPDVYISVGLPYTLQPKGSVWNCNITAGLEVDRLPEHFVKGSNQFDLTILMSQYSKNIYYHPSNTKFTKKIEVLPWGFDNNIYKPDATTNVEVESIMANIKEPAVYVFVGQCTSGELFSDRKNISNLIKDFCAAFKGKEHKPALLLKTNGVNYSIMDRNATIDRITKVKAMIPDCDVSIYLLHGELTEQQMSALYNHIKVIAFVSETRGEGQGGSFTQFSMCGKPIIASNYSGQLDCLDDKFLPLPGRLEPIPANSYIGLFPQDSNWFEVDHNRAIELMQLFYYDEQTRNIYNEKAKELAHINKTRMSIKTMEANFHTILNKHLLV